MKSSLLAAGLCVGLATNIIAQSPTPAPSPAQPPADYDLRWGVKIPMRDKVEINATLYLPKTPDGSPPKTPVIFTLTPYISDTYHAHVIGLTRRGVGESDKPARGYDTRTRVEDIRKFLDALGISKVSLIGHSMAGDELTLFATRYPDRVAKLVYLDAAYDRTPEGYLASLTDPTNYPDMMQRMRMEALGIPEAADIHVEKMPWAKDWAILVAAHKAVFAFRPDYTKVQAPALAVYAVTANQHYPTDWLPHGADASVRAKAEAWWKEKGHPLMRESVEQFRREIPHGEIMELNDAKHYVFTGDTADEVAAKTRAFLLNQ